MSRPMLSLTASALLVGLLAHTAAAQDSKSQPRSAEQTQQPLTFQAGELLDKRVLRGPNYAIDDEVRLVDGHYRFTMHTRYGDLSILGRRLLEQRVHEMYAVERLRQMGMTPQLVEGALDTVKNTPRGLGELLRDPAGAVLRTPRGLRRIIRNTVDPDKRAGSQTRRQLAVQLNCDPETTNPILSSQLDSVAGRRSLGQVLSKVGMSAAVPGLGLIPLTAEIKDVVVARTPAEINGQIARRLEAWGVAESLVKQFVSHPHYTTMQRLQFTADLEKLRDMENFSLMVRLALAADSEAEALGRIATARMLAELHADKPVAAMHDTGLPVAVLEEGANVLIATVDYLTNRPALAEAVTSYRGEFPETKTVLLATGRVSPKAANTFESAGVQILENGTIDALIAALEDRTTPQGKQSELP